MSINRLFFFQELHRELYPKGLYQSQVEGIELILDLWEARHSDQDDRWLAYMLATAYHETGGRMQPIEENMNYSAKRLREVFSRRFSPEDALAYGGQPERVANRAYGGRMGNGDEASGDGWRFRGRGLVQITGRSNYAKFGIEDRPDAALEPETSVAILFDGMIGGQFTRHKLRDFFDGDRGDWSGARVIVNPTDQHEKVGRHGQAFYRALSYTTA